MFVCVILFCVYASSLVVIVCVLFCHCGVCVSMVYGVVSFLIAFLCFLLSSFVVIFCCHVLLCRSGCSLRSEFIIVSAVAFWLSLADP